MSQIPWSVHTEANSPANSVPLSTRISYITPNVPINSRSQSASLAACLSGMWRSAVYLLQQQTATATMNFSRNMRSNAQHKRGPAGKGNSCSCHQLDEWWRSS